jgi:LmbE family N-acetylglucosaminyl deacetylase
MSVQMRRVQPSDQPAILDLNKNAKEACALLGVDEPLFMGFPDQKFDSVPMAEFAGKVGSLGYEPDLIITHAHTDLNRDHRLTLEVARIVGRPKHKPVSILGCEIPNTSIWNNQVFPANYYVDITDLLSTKISAFSKYEYELQAFPHPWSEEGLRVLAQYHGMQAGIPLAEAFHLYRGYEGRLPS